MWSSEDDHVCYNVVMRKIGAAEFKAKCLTLMDEVRSTRRPLIITKRGKPIAKLVPAEPEEDDWIGRLDGKFTITGDIVSPVVPLDDWEVLK
jgi:prevent-host-death family protein